MKAAFSKRALAFLLASVMALGLFAGCGGGGDDDSGKNSNGGSNGGELENAEFVYVPSYASVEGDFNYINTYGACVGTDRIYMTGTEYTSVDPEGNVLTEDDEDYWTYAEYETALYALSLDGASLEKLTGYVPAEIEEGLEGSVSIDRLAVDPSGALWVVESKYTYSYDAPEGVTEEDEDYWDYYVYGGTTYTLKKLDSTGAELETFDLSAIGGDSDDFYVNGIVVDGAGNVYIANDQAVYVLDSTGAELFSIDTGDYYVNDLILTSDGSAAAAYYGGSGYCVGVIDTAAKDWGTEYETPNDAYNFYNGGGDYLFYVSSDQYLFGCNAETGECEKIVNWINADVNSDNLYFVVPLEDGRVLALTQDWGSDSVNTELVTLTKTPSSEVVQKTVLTYACTYLDYSVRSRIIDFNKTNGEYRIEVLDYSEYNTDEDYEAGLTKLTTELISGNVPDLLSTSDLPIEQYAAKGLLVDLYTLMDEDSEMTRDSFVPAVLQALESEGKLYQICSSFGVYTVMGDKDKIGAEPGWTLSDLEAVMAAQPEGTEVFEVGTTRSDMLTQACAFSIDDYVNWQTGECSFDSEGFVKLLEFCNSFPAEFDWDNYEWTEEDDTPNRVMSGKQLLVATSIYDFEDFQMCSAMFNDNVVFKGFPCESKNGNALVMNSSGIAVTTSCEHQDGAWAFIKTLLDEKAASDTYGFPTNQAAFDAKLKEAMTPEYETDPETGEQVEVSRDTWGWGSLKVEINALTQEEADTIVDMINSVSTVYKYDSSVMEIITDEAAAYFNGEKTAQDTAALIQSRVNIYVNEQR